MKVVESGAAGRPFCYHNKRACNAIVLFGTFFTRLIFTLIPAIIFFSSSSALFCAILLHVSGDDASEMQELIINLIKISLFDSKCAIFCHNKGTFGPYTKMQQGRNSAQNFSSS